MKATDDGSDAVFLEALITGDVGQAIMNQEKRGQTDLSRSSKLPIESRNSRKDFEALGIVFGENVDDLFVNVTLPEGWRVEPTEHSMWSNLVDVNGRVVATIFYKAAFYDRQAFIGLKRED